MKHPQNVFEISFDSLPPFDSLTNIYTSNVPTTGSFMYKVQVQPFNDLCIIEVHTALNIFRFGIVFPSGPQQTNLSIQTGLR